MICLDTNVIIAVVNRRSELIRRRFYEAVAEQPVFISTIVLYELHFGIAKSQRREASGAELDILLAVGIEFLPFGIEDAIEAGDIRADLERAGRPIGPYDLLIAAQARRRDAVLVTANREEFARVPGLRLDDWSTPIG